MLTSTSSKAAQTWARTKGGMSTRASFQMCGRLYGYAFSSRSYRIMRWNCRIGRPISNLASYAQTTITVILGQVEDQRTLKNTLKHISENSSVQWWKKCYLQSEVGNTMESAECDCLWQTRQAIFYWRCNSSWACSRWTLLGPEKWSQEGKG